MTVIVTPPNQNLIHTHKPSVRIDLEWMWAKRQNEPETKQSHFFYITLEDESDIPEQAETFVILGN
ncbi:hypothetical protein [Paenibacillus periandrae]|uniref:hypothetical protein n=1 Tax=Paenibacillus periandrae TaxID=1761741 RepID=UPI001F0961AE|nr:hypothetical protein [Paenibacillus periandrae]